MKLKEFEAKQLLKAVGIVTSSGALIYNINEIPEVKNSLVKAQTLAGGRGKAGGIIEVHNQEEAKQKCLQFLGKDFLNEKVTEILLDEKVDVKKEYYLGIMFDTSKKCPVILFSEDGGVEIEDAEVIKKEINYLQGLTKNDLDEVPEKVKEIFLKLYQAFIRFDCRMIEVNPLALDGKGNLIALDAVAVLDDDAKWRAEFNFPERTNNREATAREIAARQIDKDDHRGVAGKTFIDLDGDIAILTSGGGASMTLMDALMDYEAKPANFTEYSGDPPQEKVEKLTRIVLNKKNLSGLLIGGVIANFTNIAETLRGILTVLIEKKPKFPIVIRRAGPNDEEAKKMMMDAKNSYNLDLHYYDENTPLTKAVDIMVELSQKYKNENPQLFNKLNVTE